MLWRITIKNTTNGSVGFTVIIHELLVSVIGAETLNVRPIVPAEKKIENVIFERKKIPLCDKLNPDAEERTHKTRAPTGRNPMKSFELSWWNPRPLQSKAQRTTLRFRADILPLMLPREDFRSQRGKRSHWKQPVSPSTRLPVTRTSQPSPTNALWHIKTSTFHYSNSLSDSSTTISAALGSLQQFRFLLGPWLQVPLSSNSLALVLGLRRVSGAPHSTQLTAVKLAWVQLRRTGDKGFSYERLPMATQHLLTCPRSGHKV